MALDKRSDVSEVDKINMSNIDQCSDVLKKLISLNSSEIISEICNLSNNCNFTRSEIPYFMNYSSCTSFPSDEYTPYKKRLETYLVPFLFAIIFIVGVVGNGTLIAVFIRHRAMRNVPNTYILSLALADLLVIVTCVPFTSTVYTVESWPWGEPVCRLSETVKDVSIGVSVFTLTALSADRYFAIVDPLRKLHATGGSKRASRCTIASAICIWVLAALCALPAAIGSYLREFPQFKTCYPYPEAWGPEYARTMVLLHFLVYYAAPLAIIGLFYALMARHLVLSARNAPGEAQGTQRQMRARRKVAITVLAFVLLFAICFLPYHLFMMWFYFCPSAEEDYNPFWHALRIVGFCLSFLNSCVNPIALYCVSGTFRKHFNRYLFCGRGGALGGLARDTTGRGTDMSRTSRKQYSNVSTRRTNVTASFRRPTLSREATITLLGNGKGHRPSDTGAEPFRISQSML